MLYALTFALFVLTALSLWYEIIRTPVRREFPFLSFVCVYYLFFYGVAPIWTVHFEQHPVYPLAVSAESAIFMFVFVSMQAAGFICIAEIIRRRARSDGAGLMAAFLPPGGRAERIDPVPLSMLALIFVGGHFLFDVLTEMQRLPSVNQLRQPLWNFGFALLVWLTFQARGWIPRIGLAAVLLGVGGVYVDLKIAAGSITQIVMTVMICVLCALSLRYFRVALLGLVAMLVLLSSYGYVKHAANIPVRGEPGLIFQFKPDLAVKSVLASINSMARRSAHVLVLQKVVDKTPAEIPFASHTPFLDAARNHVPRLFWPGKPKEQIGNWFGKRYGFISENDDTTSWNLPWVVEFYLTFGFAQAVALGFAIGGALAVATGFLSARRLQAVSFAVFAASVFPLFYQESNFSVMTGNFFWLLAFCSFAAYLFLYLYKRAFGNV